MKILITGSTGLLGLALSSRLARSSDVIGLSRSSPPRPVAGRHLRCDLTDRHQTRRLIGELAPEVVIHAQALSDVDRCQQEPELAQAMNVETTRNLVEALGGLKPLFLYISISTDYVFDGTKGAPYDESDPPHPLGVYGMTKLEAERVALSAAPAIVVRLSTLFGPGRKSFCDQIVSRLSSEEPVEAFTDQTTSPTYTEDAAEGLEALIHAVRRLGVPALPSRIVHLANAGGCSRFEFARHVARLLDRPSAGIRPIRMAEQARPAPRPAYSALDTRYLGRLIGKPLQPWTDAVEAYLRP